MDTKLSNNTHKTKYVAYIRVSTEKQGRSGLGLEAQKSIILSNVKKENVIRWFEEHKSGKNLTVLTELENAKKFAKENNCILVLAKTDRLRNTQQALDLVDELTPEGIFFCNIGRNADKFMLTLFFAFAEKERLENSIRTKAALNELKKKGIKLGRYTHKSYKNKQKQKVYEKIAENGKLGAIAMKEKAIKNENNMKSAFAAFSLRLQGKTYKEIACELNDSDFKTQTGGKWTQSGVYKNLKRFSSILNEQEKQQKRK